MMKQTHFIYLFVVFFLFSCHQNNKKQNNKRQVKVVEAKGYIVPKDSMATPKVTLVDESKLKKTPAGKPIVVLTNTNIHIAGIPKITVAGIPRVCTPGQDTFKLPKTVTVKDSPFVADIPEITIAKDAYTKDQNPQNFSSFKVLQGLKQSSISCLLEDKSGNLWFGSYGGVSKYDGKSFTTYTKKEGLCNNVILSMLQDKSGNIWFGTSGGGVSKFDGKSFTTYTEKEGLSSNTVWRMLQDKSGNIWFATSGGVVSKFDGKSFKIYTEKEGLSNNIVHSIIEDKDGNIWFGTDGGGVSKYDGKSFTTYTEKEGLSNNVVLSMFEDKSGNIWFGTWDGGVSKYDGKSFTTFTEKEGLCNNVVWSILEDKSKNLWFGTDGGVSKYDGKSFTTFSEKEGLNNNLVMSILQDKSGNLWFGTDGGVSKYDGKSFTMYTEKDGLSNKNVEGILEDKSKNLWFCTNGGGVSRYDGKSFETYTEKEGLSSNVVICILQDKLGNFWFGTNSGGISKFDGKFFTTFTEKEGLCNNVVLSILEDKSGNLWFGTWGGGVSKYDGKSFTTFTKKEGLCNNIVSKMLEDKSGNIWFTTNGGGISKFDGKSFTTYTEKDGLGNNAILSIIEDKNGNFWFGTNGGGISKYDGKFFTTYNEKDGLSNNYVSSILQDKSGNLWFGTRFGLSKLTIIKQAELNDKVKSNSLNEEDVFFKNYTYEDGFLGIGCSINSICEANDGAIWMGTNDRLTVYNPDSFLEQKEDISSPNIQLTSIKLFNENVAWASLENKKDSTVILGNGVGVSNFEFDGLSKWYNLPEHLSLAYNNNYLTFNFIGITMMQPKKIKYQYKLEGIDENWSALSNRTEAPYGNLPHGTYTFKVKAMNSEGYWSNEFNYVFTIRPPWWQTWWFKTLVGLLIIGTVWYYIKSREKKLVAEKEKLEKTVEERTAEVVEQKHLIEEKHKEITDSINYAERIQRSFLATKELLDDNLKDYFVFFKPKDVVSGDFYWASKLNNGNFALVTADSTGHGVPGAIMSLLNITSIEKAIENNTQPSEIFNATRNTIINRLKKDGSAEGGKDGMDASLTVYDFKNYKLTIAAANNPVWIVRGSETIDIKPDKMPVGKHDKDTVSFTQQEITLQKGDVVYTLTDGFPDQFGGEKGKKFMSKNLRELLSANAYLPMQEQKDILTSEFNSWKGDLEQVDDVCLIGIRI